MASGFHGTLTLETLPLQYEKKSWFPLPDEIENPLYEKCIQEDLLDNRKLTSYLHDTSHGSIISKETMSRKQWRKYNAACDGTKRWPYF